MKTIICATDFSANAENAVKYAIEMNKVLKAKIILIHTYETPLIYSDAAPFTMQLDFKYIHDEAARKLKAFHNKLFKKTDNVEMVLQQGLPSSRICDLALEKKADMIIMGSTGTGVAERMVFGSNALRVSRNAHCKVMLIPSKAKFNGLNKLVYSTDLSDDNLIQARELFPLAKKFNSDLLFLHVDNTMLGKDDETLNEIIKKIKKFVSYSKKSGYVCTDASIPKGVEYFLKKNKADVLVLFHRQRNLIQTLYKTSLSKNISLHTNIPTLFLHVDDFQD